MAPAEEVAVDYAAEALVADAAFRDALLRRIAEAGAAIEALMGAPQDVEGVVTPDGDIFIVQTRPQV